MPATLRILLLICGARLSGKFIQVKLVYYLAETWKFQKDTGSDLCSEESEIRKILRNKSAERGKVSPIAVSLDLLWWCY